ncbi:NADP-dependent oxidoreductase domain-containing protein [Scenedesmus sp. NREL 46B-D3]|nr:NADP-dependent oxidoreductase domain-containing protein [Scenedesmus sp. NREL 46B-D3]
MHVSHSGLLWQGRDFRGTGIKLIQRALELGVTLFNTSDLYGPYTNEQLLGKALKNAPRESYTICTKWGPMFDDNGAVSHTQTRDYARKACEGALQRLGTDYIDLFTLRGPVQPGTDIADLMQELKELVAEGKIRHVGLSEVGPDQIRAAAAVVPITAIEQEWSLFVRDLESDLLPVCRELGIGVLAYSPLGRGLLTGQLKDTSKLDPSDFRVTASPWFDHGNLQQNLKLVAAVEQMAARKGVTAGQLATAWLLAKSPDVIPIPGTKRVAALEENVGAAAVCLTAEEVAELEAAVPVDGVAGERYAHMQHLTYKGNM